MSHSYWVGVGVKKHIVLVFDLAAVARSEVLSWNRAWGRGSPGVQVSLSWAFLSADAPTRL